MIFAILMIDYDYTIQWWTKIIGFKLEFSVFFIDENF